MNHINYAVLGDRVSAIRPFYTYRRHIKELEKDIMAGLGLPEELVTGVTTFDLTPITQFDRIEL